MTGEQKPGGLSTTPDLAGLCERLRDQFGDPTTGGFEYTNPDGPEAAAAIESLVAENERMRALSERNLVLMKTTVRRLRRLGRPHADLDEAIAETRTALEGASDDR